MAVHRAAGMATRSADTIRACLNRRDARRNIRTKKTDFLRITLAPDFLLRLFTRSLQFHGFPSCFVVAPGHLVSSRPLSLVQTVRRTGSQATPYLKAARSAPILPVGFRKIRAVPEIERLAMGF